MARHLLTDAQCRNAEVDLHDGDGLYLVVSSPSSASWVYRYQLRKKRTRMGLGSYPDVSLRRARELAQEARSLVKEGKDPQQARKAAAVRTMTFQQAFDDYLDSKRATIKNEKKWLNPMQHILPKLGAKQVADIDVDDVVAVLQPLWQDKYPTAKRVFERVRSVLIFAKGKDSRVRADAADLAKAQLGAVKHKAESHEALAWKDMPKLWKAIGSTVAHEALRFYLLTVVRVANVTFSDWAEIDERGGVWTIPAERMKTEGAFRVPLAWQAVDVLRRARRWGTKGYIFPSSSAHKKGVISENTWNKWFRENGWHTTAHGIRSTFRDWCAEEKICDDKLAERCIQHEVRGQVERAYFRTDQLEERRMVMERWAEFVTGLTAHDFAETVEAKVMIAHDRRRAARRIGIDLSSESIEADDA